LQEAPQGPFSFKCPELRGIQSAIRPRCEAGCASETASLRSALRDQPVSGRLPVGCYRELVGPTDPERRRFEELVALVDGGGASEEDRAELDLYLAEDPALRAELSGPRAAGPPADRQWLVRAAADDRVHRLERRRLVVVERIVGGVLLGGGIVLAPALPVIAPVAALTGLGILAWSTVALRLRELRDDPYRKIDR
jgi:hypothetical protein